MEAKQVYELMIPLEDYPSVYEDQSLKEAISELSDCQIDVDDKKSMPRVVLVFTREGKLAGIVRRRDIFRGLEPAFLARKPLKQRKDLFDLRVDPEIMESSGSDQWIRGILERAELSYDSLVKGILERASRTVSNVMQAANVTIAHDKIFVKAIYEMVDKNVSLLPVTKDGKVVGVVRSVELFLELSRVILDPPDWWDPEGDHAIL